MKNILFSVALSLIPISACAGNAASLPSVLASVTCSKFLENPGHALGVEPRYVAIVTIIMGDHFAKVQGLHSIIPSMHTAGADLPAAIAIKAISICSQQPTDIALSAFESAYNYERAYEGLFVVEFPRPG